MTNFRWLLVAVCVLTAVGLSREPLFRPSKKTVLAWMDGEQIIVVPVADYRAPVVERLDPKNVQDLKHVYGSTYRRFWFPHYGVADYTFRYLYQDKINSYSLQVRYDWSLRPGWVLRGSQGISIVGPKRD